MAMQLLKVEKPTKGDTGRIIGSAAIGGGLGFAQKFVQENGTSVGGVNLGTAMPAIEIAAGVGLQFQKNATLRGLGLVALAIGTYEAGKQGIGAIIDGAKPAGSVSSRKHSKISQRGSQVPQTRSMGSNLHSLYS